MKTLRTIKNTLVLTFAAACFVVGPATETKAETLAMTMERPQDNGNSRAKAEKVNKPMKRKKVKPQRTNHGPRKALFPQLDRQRDPLTRATYKDTYKNRH